MISSVTPTLCKSTNNGINILYNSSNTNLIYSRPDKTPEPPGLLSTPEMPQSSHTMSGLDPIANSSSSSNSTSPSVPLVTSGNNSNTNNTSDIRMRSVSPMSAASLSSASTTTVVGSFKIPEALIFPQCHFPSEVESITSSEAAQSAAAAAAARALRSVRPSFPHFLRWVTKHIINIGTDSFSGPHPMNFLWTSVAAPVPPRVPLPPRARVPLPLLCHPFTTILLLLWQE